MIAEFKTYKQNFKDLRTMIEESKKQENTNFGQEIFSIAQEVKDKREKEIPKKNFQMQHT